MTRPLYRFVNVGGATWNVVQAESTGSTVPADNAVANAYAPGGVGTTPEEQQLAVSFVANRVYSRRDCETGSVPRSGCSTSAKVFTKPRRGGVRGLDRALLWRQGVVEIEMSNLVKFMGGIRRPVPRGLTSASIPTTPERSSSSSLGPPRASATRACTIWRITSPIADDTLPRDMIAPPTSCRTAAPPITQRVAPRQRGAQDLNGCLRFPEGGAPGRPCRQVVPRSVRLVNGQRLRYDVGALSWGDWHKGVTVASEQGVYILGNYNAVDIDPAFPPSALAPTADIRYRPYANAALPATWTSGQVPASVVSDAVTILSTAWNDGKSFAWPFTLANRVGDETDRTEGAPMGDTRARGWRAERGRRRTSAERWRPQLQAFLETWGSDRLNYCAR